MAYVPTVNELGIQPIALTSTTQNHPLGKIIPAADATLGGGEFIYLLGVASTVVGSLVTYDASTWQTALAANTADQGLPVAVAMSANVASSYGWYQIAGMAVITRTAQKTSPQVKIFLSGTAGSIMTSTVSGKAILGARSANLTTLTSTAGVLTCVINRPTLQIRTI